MYQYNNFSTTQISISKITDTLKHIIIAKLDGELVDRFNGTFHTLEAANGKAIKDISFTLDENLMITGGDNQILTIYSSTGDSIFSFYQSVNIGINITRVHITDDKKFIFVAGLSNSLFIIE